MIIKDKLIGNKVFLEEIEDKYFDFVVNWRNANMLKKHINHVHDLTIDEQKKWYEGYLNRKNEVFYVLIDKGKDIPFGTFGAQNIDFSKKQCVIGRLIVGDELYLGTAFLIESVLILYDYMFEGLKLEKCYCHIADNNKKVISFDKKFGFVENFDIVQFPELLCDSFGFPLKEYVMSKERFFQKREKIVQLIK